MHESDSETITRYEKDFPYDGKLSIRISSLTRILRVFLFPLNLSFSRCGASSGVYPLQKPVTS